MTTLTLTVSEPDDTPGEPPATFRLRGESAVIGRDPQADLVVADASVSLRHGLFSPDAHGYRFTDLQSTNGSVLLRDGRPESCPAGLALPLQDGDLLQLGSASRPVVLTISTTAAQTRPVTPSLTRTIIARSPLVDPQTPSPSPSAVSSLAAFAARALTADNASTLASVALASLEQLCPHAALRGVALWGPGLNTTQGAPLPSGLRELALSGRLEFAELAVTGTALPIPQTQSLVTTNTSAALIVPLTVRTTSWGVAFASSPLGADAFPNDVTEHFALLGPILALAASELSNRLSRAAPTPLLPPTDGPLGVSPPFVEVVTLTRQVATADVPVLIHGETGSGKEVLARFLHAQSRRASAPFIAFNCAAIPENLIESELFGHTRGAFTSATSDRKGLFEEAHTGTLFLDEIGEMPLSMQAKLLRVLQDGEVRRVGQNRPITVDVRVVSATHRDLKSLVADNRFRADLMYRLNAVTLTLPPLRERPEDIPLLAHAFLARASKQTRKTFPGFAPDALWALSLHPFPGNVRELDNEILRAAALTPDNEPIPARSFSPALRDRAPAAPGQPQTASNSVVPLRDAVAQAERHAIERALSAAQGNVSEAARLLEVTRAGLYKAMERLGLK